MNNENNCVPGSFRDPSGFLFFRDGILYRQINREYIDHYNHFINSGLYDELVSKKLLILHQEIDPTTTLLDNGVKIISPLMIPFISYPYEWCFSQLKDAALLTLRIQETALNYGMTLKDASAYNVQFYEGKPVFIDTLSFVRYNEGETWVAYRQFCMHFLAPLLLMRYRDIRLNQLLRIYLDGIPLDLTSSLLPPSMWLRFSPLIHINLHARSEKQHADRHISITARRVSINALRGIINNLFTLIEKLKWNPGGTEWASYYQDTNYTSDALEDKKAIFNRFIETVHPSSVWDLGANNGLFSRIASDKGIPTIAFDIDPACVEMNYRQIVEENEHNLLPLLLDLTNPSPALGWSNNERSSLAERGPADTVVALALIHHLAISNNVPFKRIARYFSGICNSLIIEFVPKTDSQIQKMLMNREDIFSDYSEEKFENDFSCFFTIEDKQKIKNSTRIIYLMKKR